MTKEEASKKYCIPIEVLDEYEQWGLCDTVKKVFGNWQYDDTDIENLSMIMTLRDIGFANSEIATYIELVMQGDATLVRRQQILNKKRDSALDAMHFQQKCVDRLDYLRYEIAKARKKQ